MAPQPKKKRTKTKKGTRWSHSQLQPVALSLCSQCKTLKPSHRVCPNCGYYAGREVVAAAQPAGVREE